MMPTTEQLQQIESLIWTGDNTNIRLAEEISKGLGMNEIPLLENLYLTTDVLTYVGRLLFTEVIKMLQKQELTLYNVDAYEDTQEFQDGFAFMNQHLRRLHLKYRLEPLPRFPDCLKQLDQLVFLHIAKDFFTMPQVFDWFDFPNLQTLDLHESTMQTKFELPKLKHLRVCEISEEQLPILEQLANFPMLETVHLEFLEGWYQETHYGKIYHRYTHYDYQKVVAKVTQFPLIQLTTDFINEDD